MYFIYVAWVAEPFFISFIQSSRNSQHPEHDFTENSDPEGCSPHVAVYGPRAERRRRRTFSADRVSDHMSCRNRLQTCAGVSCRRRRPCGATDSGGGGPAKGGSMPVDGATTCLEPAAALQESMVAPPATTAGTAPGHRHPRVAGDADALSPRRHARGRALPSLPISWQASSSTALGHDVWRHRSCCRGDQRRTGGAISGRLLGLHTFQRHTAKSRGQTDGLCVLRLNQRLGS